MIPLTTEIIILVLIGILNVLFGFFIFAKGEKTNVNKAFILLLLNLAAWSWGLAFARTVEESHIALIATRILYGISEVIPFLFLTFVALFVSSGIRKLWWWYLIPLAAILAITLFSGGVIESISFNNRGLDISHFGNLYLVFVAYMVTYFGIGLFITFKKFLDATNKQSAIRKSQLRLILVGSIVPIVIGTTTNIFLLSAIGLFDYRWLGPASTLALTAFFGYAIFKHHLFNIRVIATELFTALILIVVLVDTILANNPREFLIKSGVFLTVLVFSIFLIRGTLREIRELERLSRAKSDFVSIVSHQLRTPLTAIKGFISMIKEDSGTEEDKRDWLEKTYISNERLIRLVNDILNISRIERGTIKYDFQYSSIIELIDGVAEEVRDQIKKRGLSLVWEKPSYDIPKIRIDSDKLRQVFINLTDNAMKYTEKGSILLRVNYLRDLNRIQIIVQDTGIGIKEDDLKDLFAMFSRGGSGEKTNAGGMGIGLYVAKQIVLAHKGRIWVESEGRYKGSKFYVELPIE